MKLSIIVPVYNVEDYVAKTLQSCLFQNVSFDDYEIIVVNDGTKDNSMAVVNETIQGYSNVRVIEQENQGLSGARLSGLDAAKGDYIWFVDSDDYIKEGSLRTILDACSECDIITIGYAMYKNNIVIKKYLPKNVNEGVQLLGGYFPQGAVFYIYNRFFLIRNNLRFIKGIFHEDFEFTPRALFLAKKVKCISLPIYCYMLRDNSITQNHNSKRAFDLLIVAKSLQCFKNNINNKKAKIAFHNLIGLAINNALNIICRSERSEQDDWLKEFANNNFAADSLLHCSSIKYKLEGVMLVVFKNISPILLYRGLQLINFNSKAR